MKNKTCYFTLTGCHHHYGTDFLKPKMTVDLRKDPKNEYDREAICVELDGLGLIGYVANSVSTVHGESMSAGRLYDKIGKKAKAKVVYVFPPYGALCEIKVEK